MTVSNATYDLKLPGRVLVPTKPDGPHPRWLVASASLEENKNEVHQVIVQSSYRMREPHPLVLPPPNIVQSLGPQFHTGQRFHFLLHQTFPQIEYRADTREITNISTFAHKFEVVDMAVSEGAHTYCPLPFSKTLLLYIRTLFHKHEHHSFHVLIRSGSPGSILTLSNATAANSVQKRITFWSMKERRQEGVSPQT